ncbi:hypothetical protein [Novacetimonas hansenii]|uniref:hypothetical protein n=1 Tax=Novacetimonas hansenii TaxID=436 RepID=UPI000DA03468|nr:hypothetical protein CFR74_12440 [Novacetimonas hansenii]
MRAATLGVGGDWHDLGGGFLNTFETTIDSGCGLVKGSVVSLAGSLSVLDIVLAGLVVGGVAMIAVAFALGYALESNTPKGPVQTAQDIDARASADGLSALPCARVLWTGNSGISGGWDYDAGRHESCCQFLPYSSILPP